MDIKKESVSAVKWVLLRKLTMNPLQLIFGIVISRLVSPEEVGIMGLTAIFFAIACDLSTSGFGAALIRKLDRTEDDINTAFWFNIGASFLLSFTLYSLAPFFASFFGYSELLWLTRISAIVMFLNSTANIHWTLFQCNRNFKIPALVGIASSLVGMPVCVFLAYHGWGVWALMAQNVLVSLLSLILVWIISPWKPKLIFSKGSFIELYGFGFKVAVSGILHTLYLNLQTFIIGKFYSAAQLGLYNRAHNIAGVIPNLIISVVSSVVYPLLAPLQTNKTLLLNASQNYIKAFSIPFAWWNILLSVLSIPVVSFVYGESWVSCAAYLQILVLAKCTNHIVIINSNILLVLGNSGLMLKIEFLKKIVSLLLISIAAFYGVKAICFSILLYSSFSLLINSYFYGKALHITIFKQLKDFIPFYFFAFVSCIPAIFLCHINIPDYLQVLAGGLSSFLLYFGYLYISKNSAFIALLKLIKERRNNIHHQTQPSK